MGASVKYQITRKKEKRKKHKRSNRKTTKTACFLFLIPKRFSECENLDYCEHEDMLEVLERKMYFTH